MKTRIITFLLLCSLFCCSAQSGWSQQASASDTCINSAKEVVYQKAFSGFMAKVRTQSFNKKKKQQLAKEYSALIDQMDELYHGTPSVDADTLKFSMQPETVAHVVVNACKRDQK